ncbi:MAG: hypothetical protein DRO14_01130 [Thermoprotei archaeon]|nr:MAG: hypothetical protein DRO14_01130 [Thermoprotei archaeon]
MYVVSEKAAEEGKKRDIKALVAVIPPATQLRKREGPKVKERRIRVRLKPDIKEGELHISPSLAQELSIKEVAELSVPGKKKMRFKAVLDDKVPVNEVWVSEEVMKERGVADNTLATVRGA